MESEKDLNMDKRTTYYTEGDGASYAEVRMARVSDEVQTLRAKKISRYISKNDRVLDFGCGTGGILSRVDCATKLGVEISPEFISKARECGLEVATSIESVGDASIDVIYAHHSLEHVPDPLHILSEFHRILAVGGKCIIVVPSENPRNKRFASWKIEPNRHLFSWTPLSIGNLIVLSGFRVEFSKVAEIIGSTRIEMLPLNRALKTMIGRAVAKYRGRYECICVASKADLSG